MRASIALAGVLACLSFTGAASAVLPPSPGAVSPQTLKLPDGPASVRGLSDTPSISPFSGQLTYAIPIELPSAIGGFQPVVSLGYSGALGNGPMGIGWTLGEMSIRRTERFGVPTFTDADELEIHGIAEGRLALTPDGSYRVEGHANGIRVVKSGSGFVVTTPDGAQYALGLTANGRHEANGKTAAWLVESITDLTKQAITYTYLQRDGQIYPQTIAWGPSGVFGVTFTYESRTDSVDSYRSGFLVTTSQRLKTIDVSSFGEVLRSYALSYDETLSLSRLANLRMTGRSGHDALPTLTLTYAKASAPLMQPLTNIDGWVLNQRGVSFLDVDGDGLSDLVRAEVGAHWFRKNLGGGAFADAVRITGADSTELPHLRFMDLDGDTRPELVHPVLDTWRAQKLSGTTWQTATTLRGSLAVPFIDPNVAFADVNGDGKTDVLRVVTQGMQLLRGDGTGFGAPVSVPIIDPSNPTVLPSNPAVRAHDVNGDGLVDYVWLADSAMKIYLGSGDGRFVAKKDSVAYPWSDVVDQTKTYLCDLNRDGVMDIARLAAGNVHYFRGRAGFTFDPEIVLARPESAEDDVVLAINDVDGNGSEDVVWSSMRGTWALDLAGATTAGMLVKIENGLGKEVNVEYAASAQLSAQARASGSPWGRQLPIAIPVPVRMVTHTGADEPDRAVRVEVRDGFYDGLERRFGGFLTSRQHAESTVASTVETTYEEGVGDRRVLRGTPLVVKTFDDKGQLVLVHTTTRDTAAVPGLGTSPLLRASLAAVETEDHYEGVPQAITTRVERSYDDQGRMIEERKLGRVDVSGDETTSFATFASDDTLWVRDKVVTEGTKDVTGAVVRARRSFFGDETTTYPLGQIGKGWTKRVESRLVDAVRGEVWRLDRAFTYDARGLTIAEQDGEVLHERVYDPTGLFLQTERVTSSGKVIAWQATWDQVQALVTSVTDPNGEVTFDTYDGIGRLVSRAHVQGKPYETYDYDWTPPRPRTTTHLFEGDERTMQPFVAWAPGSGWRESVAVTTGAGEPLFTATRVAADRWVVDQYTVRDDRGHTTFRAEPFESAAVPAALPAGIDGESFVVDALGRTASHTLATGAVKTSQFSAFGVVTTSDGLVPVTSLFDGLGHVVHTERVVDGTREQVDATFDAAGEITRLALQGGAVVHDYVYDSLGRLVGAHDPDSGSRTLHYNDFDQLVDQVNGAGQTVHYEYDDVGRVTVTRTDDGRAFIYHYDVPKDGGTGARTIGRVAWIEEPLGEVHYAYERDGALASQRRIVKGRSLTESRAYGASGGLLKVSYDDGFAFDIGYDDAGRPARLGDFWQALKLDARGAVTQGKFGNGIVETFDRDPMGQPKHVRIERASGSAIYDVTVQRAPFGAIKSVQDGDGVGLDHTATFDFDGAGRIKQATIGSATRQFQFAYGYDGLENMLTRAASGPKALGILAGTYVYGESGKSPRQLTTVHTSNGDTHFDYDAAGRMVREGDSTLVYNQFDELAKVLDASGASKAEHEYGFDGLRTWTKNTDGTEQVWLASDVTEKDGQREHTVAIGGRTIAKVTMPIADLPVAAAGPLAQAGRVGKGLRSDDLARASFAGVVALGFMCLVWAARFGRAVRRGAVSFASAGMMAILAACSSNAPPSESTASERAAIIAAAWNADARVYFHQGFAAGPVLFTRNDATIEEERTYEPFGEALDAYRESAGIGSIGDVDFKRESRNVLGNETDPNTRFDYQGARWMAPQLARWFTPDPPTKAPDPKFLFAPWDLNPYAYARSNPLLFWDPDGQSWKSFAKGFIVGAVTAVATTVAVAAVAAVAPAAATVIGGVMLAKGAYDLYQNRHELAAMGHRIVSGTTTDADHEAFGNMVGSFVGGKVGGGIAGKLFKAPPTSAPKAPKEPAPSCAGGKCTVPGNCFVAGTLVASAGGLEPIESIHAGDEVLSRDPETGETELRTVVETYVRHADALEEVDVRGDDGREEHISTTPEHPFWITGQGWIHAKDLAPGDETSTATGTHVIVTRHTEHAADVTVYNFQVDGFHTYFVGESGVWVHNECGSLHPGEINFSQRSVNRKFDTPKGKISMDKAIRQGPGQVKEFPPIKVQNVKGQWVARDGNSRLAIARETGAQSIKVDFESGAAARSNLAARTSANGLPLSGTPKVPSW